MTGQKLEKRCGFDVCRTQYVSNVFSEIAAFQAVYCFTEAPVFIGEGMGANIFILFSLKFSTMFYLQS